MRSNSARRGSSRFAKKVGEIRPTQLLHSSGVGALIDLPNLSVMVMGLDEWDLTHSTVLTEQRLLAQVKRRLGDQVEQLLMPPAVQEGNGFGNDALGYENLVGVPCSPFPRWMVCPVCKTLAPLSSGLFNLDPKPFAPERSRFVHTNCRAKKPPAVLPVRFMVACEAGHLDDFPWVDFVHRGEKCERPQLRLEEFGVSGEAADVQVKCTNCGSSRRMSAAFGEQGKQFLPYCKGRHPHLRSTQEEGCTGDNGGPHQLKTLLLGASNAWFPAVVSAISIPQTISEIGEIIALNWADLNEVEQLIEIKHIKKSIPLLKKFEDHEVLKAIQDYRARLGDQGFSDADIKAPEWEVLSNPGKVRSTRDFVLSQVAVPGGFEGLIEKVVLVEKMREVRSIIGFSRIDSLEDFALYEEGEIQRLAPLSRTNPKWVPATEVRGEGIFIQFSETRLHDWLQKKAVRELSEEIFQGHCRWRRTRNIDHPEAGFRGMRFVLLHSFAHALMRQFSLECGYTSASIRERIYSAESTEPSGPMAGVLIYTVASDSEGTLGGLVSLGRAASLILHLSQALERARLCSSDPLCSEHHPASDRYTIHAAACHACLFLSETSCECGNRYLDRSVLAETLNRSETAFFSGGEL
ncbi:MAG: hypothetical protein GHCLOJNM_02285 [bacterium]|nr:hypothetical protein [bacterium]